MTTPLNRPHAGCGALRRPGFSALGTRCVAYGFRIRLGGILSIVIALMGSAQAQPDRLPFGIQVVDEQTGRGVPLVELTTVSEVRFITDSAGWAAIDDPALLGRKVFFTVHSHGYEFPKDGFGFLGRAIDLTPGGSAILKIKRLNIAQRLYRVTGEGIYRDSVILGKPVPIRQPLLNAQVVGQDSIQAAIFNGKIHWFWGDTNRQRYPLGHFWMAGATSALAGKGGTEPNAGIDLDYYVDNEGFSRGTIDRVDNHPMWLDGLMVVKDANRTEHLVGQFSEQKSLEQCVGRGLYEFNAAAGKWDRKLIDIPLDAPIRPDGHPLLVKTDGIEYYYCGNDFANVRTKADYRSVQDLAQYDAYTCLKPGSRLAAKANDAPLDRDAASKLVWAWKRDAPPLPQELQEKLIHAGKMKPDETPFRLVDPATGKFVQAHAASVRWNEFRKRYVMIVEQLWGDSSVLGEIWYAEADRPEGPWHDARKIVTHDKYSFYNPLHHAFLDADGGRIIYFEATYSKTFAGDIPATPRYDYNQVMYRLDLADERLRSP